jgi:hypothetical protein
MPAKFIEKNGKMLAFEFTCDGCKSEGRIELNESEFYKPFGCPEGCGATFILWHSPEGPAIQCVVCPIFEDEISAGQEANGTV